jgi:hypothetical protein
MGFRLSPGAELGFLYRQGLVHDPVGDLGVAPIPGYGTSCCGLTTSPNELESLALPGSVAIRAQERRTQTAQKQASEPKANAEQKAPSIQNASGTMQTTSMGASEALSPGAQGSGPSPIEKLQARKTLLKTRLQELRTKESLSVQELQQEVALVDELTRIERREQALQTRIPVTPTGSAQEGHLQEGQTQVDTALTEE